jgi:hypothetical protein
VNGSLIREGPLAGGSGRSTSPPKNSSPGEGGWGGGGRRRSGSPGWRTPGDLDAGAGPGDGHRLLPARPIRIPGAPLPVHERPRLAPALPRGARTRRRRPGTGTRRPLPRGTRPGACRRRPLHTGACTLHEAVQRLVRGRRRSYVPPRPPSTAFVLPSLMPARPACGRAPGCSPPCAGRREGKRWCAPPGAHRRRGLGGGMRPYAGGAGGRMQGMQTACTGAAADSPRMPSTPPVRTAGARRGMQAPRGPRSPCAGAWRGCARRRRSAASSRTRRCALFRGARLPRSPLQAAARAARRGPGRVQFGLLQARRPVRSARPPGEAPRGPDPGLPYSLIGLPGSPRRRLRRPDRGRAGCSTDPQGSPTPMPFGSTTKRVPRGGRPGLPARLSREKLRPSPAPAAGCGTSTKPSPGPGSRSWLPPPKTSVGRSIRYARAGRGAGLKLCRPAGGWDGSELTLRPCAWRPGLLGEASGGQLCRPGARRAPPIVGRGSAKGAHPPRRPPTPSTSRPLEARAVPARLDVRMSGRPSAGSGAGRTPSRAAGVTRASPEPVCAPSVGERAPPTGHAHPRQDATGQAQVAVSVAAPRARRPAPGSPGPRACLRQEDRAPGALMHGVGVVARPCCEPARGAAAHVCPLSGSARPV